MTQLTRNATSNATALDVIRAIFADGIDTRSVRRAMAVLRKAYPVSARSVAMDDGIDYRVDNLLAEAKSNTKLALSDQATDRYATVGLSLAPSKENGLKTKGGRAIDFCPDAHACTIICLFSAGHARVGKNVKRARIGKSRLYVLRNEWFKARLMVEVARAAVKARKAGKTLAVRLNVFSDIAWERKFPEIFTMFPDVRFYDYTKISSRMGKTPPNYHLTFSRDETNEATAVDMLRRGFSVAVVFEDHSFPETWNGFPTIDGTAHDLRILDPSPCVVALAEKDTELHGPKYAGKRNALLPTAGFVLPTVTSNAHGQAMPTL